VNYRHAFHAGNFADCMKHALLVSLLRALARKPAAFRVLDTHAGIGRYDLLRARPSAPANGVGASPASSEANPPALADYLALVGTDGTYPARQPSPPRSSARRTACPSSSCTRPITPPSAPCSAATPACRSITATAGKPPAP
jgi:hypothetical protein